MAISENDRLFMEEVAEYYRNTKTTAEANGSIRDTAIHFGINRTKVRKILITTGDFSSEITVQALRLKEQGLSNHEIASKLKMSEATISTYLPYDNLIYNSPDVSEHAKNVRGYRAYEKKRKERQKELTQRKGDTVMGKDMGEVVYKAWNDKIKIADSGFKGWVRLHMELLNEYPTEREIEIMHQFAKVKHGDTITRDIIAPVDMPLYALHFAMQPLFGWQNSHLHEFRMPVERNLAMTNQSASMWSRMVGVLYRSPMMSEEDEFWADDYDGGSFKKWLRSKYTGPYKSLCYGEGIICCREDIESLDLDREYYVTYARAYNYDTEEYDGEEYPSGVYSVTDAKGEPISPPEENWHGKIERVEKQRFSDLQVDTLGYIFDKNHLTLLERLPISILRPLDGKDCVYADGDELYAEVKDKIQYIIKENKNTPDAQVVPGAVTDSLYYSYDFGDGWKVEITARTGCNDLVEAGRVTQNMVDQAIKKCQETYRPVLIAKDGEDVMDDVGGISGYVDFQEAIHPALTNLTEEEREEALQEQEENIEWARSQGWKRNARVRNINLL